MDISDILHIAPYSLKKSDKEKVLNYFLTQLSKYHFDNCTDYKEMMVKIGYNYGKDYHYSELPFLPVRLFKLLDLLSIDTKQILKTMTSSGTSGQAVSKIYLDSITSSNQTKILDANT